jgi:hypothetical protein
VNAEGRKLAILAILLIALAVLWYRVWQQQPAAAPPAATSSPAVGGPGTAPQGAARLQEVNLAALRAQRTAPAESRRNLFEYGAAERPAPAASVLMAPAPAAEPPPAAPPQPTLSLKLIGIAQARGDASRVAILSDERGVYHGTEGTIIEGRYRIVRVDTESVELTTLDGSGLFVLRLPPS